MGKIYRSKLSRDPKSKILKKGYINIYSKLSPQEERQIHFKNLYKKQNPKWDDSLVYLSSYIRKNLNPNTKVIDLGCGNGNYLIDENRKNIPWAVGVDADKTAVAKNICLDEIKIADLEKIPYEGGFFDIAVSLWVIEHLENPEKVFDEVARILRKGSLFIFATPNINFLPLKIAKKIEMLKVNSYLNKKLFGREEKDVFKTFYKANTVKELKSILKDKFEILEIKSNFDPSYTSFNYTSYRATKLIKKIFTLLRLDYFDSHIVGVCKKK